MNYIIMKGARMLGSSKRIRIDWRKIICSFRYLFVRLSIAILMYYAIKEERI